MDYFAIASYGVYPTPTPTGAERAAYAVTMGLFGGPLSAYVPPAFTGVAGIYPNFYGGYWCCSRSPDDVSFIHPIERIGIEKESPDNI